VLYYRSSTGIYIICIDRLLVVEELNFTYYVIRVGIASQYSVSVRKHA